LFCSKQIAGNKTTLTEVSNKLWGTKCNLRKSQTDCGEQIAIAESFKQIAGNKKQLQEVSNKLQETKYNRRKSQTVCMK